MNRRQLLRASALVPVAAALAACQGQTAQTIAAQVLADLQGLVPVGKSILAAIQQFDPAAISADTAAQITTWETAAANGLSTLSTSTPAAAGASTVQQVETQINNVLQAIGVVLPAAAVAVPALAPFVPMYDAAVALLPGIEAWVASVIPSSVAAAPKPLMAIRARYTPDQARAVLGVK